MGHAQVIRDRTPTRRTTVIATVALTPRMRRLTLAGDDLVGVAVAPAQDAELILSEPSGRRLKRRYTVRHARPSLGEWDIDALLHRDSDGRPGGPGAAFAAGAQPGDELAVIGPRGRLTVRPAAWHLLVGDESALPAIAAILEALPDGEPAVALVEVGAPDDQLPLTRPAGELDVRWLHRGDQPPGAPHLLGAAADELAAATWFPAGAGGTAGTGGAEGTLGQGYLLGESRVMIGLRPAMARLGLGPEQLYLKGYWNRARHPGPRDRSDRGPFAAPTDATGP